jgi:hypothetical protein
VVRSTFWLLDSLYWFLDGLPNQTAAVAEVVLYPGPGARDYRHPPYRTHSREDISLCVYTGGVNVKLGGEKKTYSPGQEVFIRRGTRFTFWPARASRASLVLRMSPPGVEEALYKIHGVTNRWERGAFPEHNVAFEPVAQELFQERAVAHGIQFEAQAAGKASRDAPDYDEPAPAPPVNRILRQWESSEAAPPVERIEQWYVPPSDKTPADDSINADIEEEDEPRRGRAEL